MKKNGLFCLMLLLALDVFNVFNVFASVSVIDDNVVQQNVTAVSTYLNTIKGYMAKLASTSDSLSQLTDLDGLIKTQQSLATVCDKYCSQADMDKVHQYLTSLNTNMSGQFKKFAGIINSNVKNLNEIENYINGDSANIKEIGIALQKATMQVQIQTENTLSQIQSLLSLDIEKHETEMKLEKQNSDAVSSGFTRPQF